MPAFFTLLTDEPDPTVRIVLGHFIYVYIHPYYDGNGRTGRFLMNVMMAAGGYPGRSSRNNRGLTIWPPWKLPALWATSDRSRISWPLTWATRGLPLPSPHDERRGARQGGLIALHDCLPIWS